MYKVIPYPNAPTRYERDWESTRTANYKQLAALGKLPFNPMSDYKLWKVDNPVFIPLLGRTETYQGVAVPVSPLEAFFNKSMTKIFGVDCEWSALHGRALQQSESRLYSKLRARDLDLGMALGEATETAEFISKTATTVANAFVQFKKRNYSACARTLFGSDGKQYRKQLGSDDPAKALLALKFGVEPLVSDMYNAYATITSPLEKRFDIILSTGSDITCDQIVERKISPYGTLDKIHATGSIKLRQTFLANVSNPFTYTLDQLGLTNPLATAYALLPGSFILDWFWPLGTALESVVPVVGLSDEHIVTTYIAQVSLDCESVYYAPASARQTGKYTGRSKRPGQPVYTLPAPQFGLSLGKGITALALVQTVGKSILNEQRFNKLY
jgi:hypothetical protein